MDYLPSVKNKFYKQILKDVFVKVRDRPKDGLLLLLSIIRLHQDLMLNQQFGEFSQETH